jgi:predicted RNA binding protein YcfA (HicA-like mRNA interferase family)
MKRKHLIKILIRQGCVLIRNGAKHDIFHNPAKGTTQPVPRHNDINELLAKKVLKDLSND